MITDEIFAYISHFGMLLSILKNVVILHSMLKKSEKVVSSQPG